MSQSENDADPMESLFWGEDFADFIPAVSAVPQAPLHPVSDCIHMRRHGTCWMQRMRSFGFAGKAELCACQRRTAEPQRCASVYSRQLCCGRAAWFVDTHKHMLLLLLP